MLGFITIFAALVTIILLVAGIIISKKYASIGIFYFFLIFIIKELYSFVGGPIIRNHIDSVISNNEMPMGMTIGQYVAWLNLIPKILELIAFVFLVVGLYKLKSHKEKRYN